MATKIRLKYTPKIHFKFDDSLEYASHINDLINKIHDEEEPE